VSAAVSKHHARIFAGDAGDQEIVLGRSGISVGTAKAESTWIDMASSAALAIIDDAALGGNINGTLLLALGALFEVAVAEDLE